MVATITYLILLIHGPMNVSAICGALTIFLGFWDFTLKLGRLPVFGNPIFLLVSILKLLTIYFVFFLPILFAFVMVFRTLMPTQYADGTYEHSAEFTHFLGSFVKIIAMMGGEYDFRETFFPYIQDGVYEPVGSYFISIFFVLFFIVIGMGMFFTIT